MEFSVHLEIRSHYAWDLAALSSSLIEGEVGVLERVVIAQVDQIFDKNKVLEKQEAAKIFGEIGFKVAGDIAQKMDWKEGSPEKAALHGLIGGIMAQINGGKFGDGLTVGAINELVVAELAKIKANRILEFQMMFFQLEF